MNCQILPIGKHFVYLFISHSFFREKKKPKQINKILFESLSDFLMEDKKKPIVVFVLGGSFEPNSPQFN